MATKYVRGVNATARNIAKFREQLITRNDRRKVYASGRKPMQQAIASEITDSGRTRKYHRNKTITIHSGNLRKSIGKLTRVRNKNIEYVGARALRPMPSPDVGKTKAKASGYYSAWVEFGLRARKKRKNIGAVKRGFDKAENTSSYAMVAELKKVFRKYRV